MKNILITGANGLLGSEFKARLTDEEAWFCGQADLDITDFDAVRRFLKDRKIRYIINCAACRDAEYLEDHPEQAVPVSVDGPRNLAVAAKENGAVLIHVSTDYVFDGTAHIPYTEECDPCPNSVYGTTKLEGEYEVLNHCEKSVVIRTAWLYSTFGNNFVKTMIRLGKERDSLGVIFDQVGTPTYANDLAQAIFAIINKGIVPGVYHFSNEGVCSWYDFTVAIHRLAGITSCKVKPLHTSEYPTRANRPAYSVLDKTKIKTTFGIEIPHWEESLKRCIDTL